MLHFSSASSGTVNTRRAVSDCLDALTAAPDGQPVRWIVVHTTVGHKAADIVAEAKARYPQAQVLGVSCAGVIGREGANENLRALGLMAIAGPKNELQVAVVDGVDGRTSLERGRELGRSLRDTMANVRFMGLYSTGIDVAADHLLEGLGETFPSVPVFGGTSSDHMKALTNFQFIDDRVLEHGALLIGFGDPTLSVDMVAHHGSAVLGISMTVTRCEGNRVLELDGKPAWPTLMEKLGAPATSHCGEVIPISGLAVSLPQALVAEYDNTHALCAVLKTDDNKQSFYLPVSAREGMRLSLTQRDEKLIFDGLDRMMSKLKSRLSGKKTVAVFHTDCGARGRLMFDRVLKDEIVKRMQFPLGSEPPPWLGMYGFGEYTNIAGVNGFHNYTTSLYAITRAG